MAGGSGMGSGAGLGSSVGWGNGSGGIGGPSNTSHKEVRGPVTNSGKGYITKSSSAVGKEGMIFSGGETKGAPDKATPSSVPYYEVSSNYKKAAEKALAKEEVPPAYKKPVSQYFDSLK
jgi:hypothetical protein